VGKVHRDVAIQSLGALLHGDKTTHVVVKSCREEARIWKLELKPELIGEVDKG
jgi:hypothetical protein